MIVQARITRRRRGANAFLCWREVLGEVRMQPGHLPFVADALRDLIAGRLVLEQTMASSASTETLW